ncbi:MAG: MaoC family dehydratase N-terminal domain-containing protein [Chloroflexi bacterium]|nr:MaoC family dehydratase N-terminal domain-containing protein [Chloroflexota bacterium]
MTEGKMITTIDELEAERRKGIGVMLPPAGEWVEASLAEFRYFSDGIGDYNPLWRDEEYARKTRYGTNVAPPTFILKVFMGEEPTWGSIDRKLISAGSFPANFAGFEMEFFRPIMRGDKVRWTERVGDVQRKMSQRVGPILFAEGLNTYYNQRMEKVATLNCRLARYKNIGGAINYDRGAKPGAVTESADSLVWERTRRGSETLYWDDVAKGEELPTLKKGTFTSMELIYYWLLSKSHGDSRTKEGPLMQGHLDEKDAANVRNMPGTFDEWGMRGSWLAQIVSDWMGDEGTFKKLQVSLRHPNVAGDTNTVYGRVDKKYIEGDQHLVDVEVWNRNQAELITATGWATVALPSRS